MVQDAVRPWSQTGVLCRRTPQGAFGEIREAQGLGLKTLDSLMAESRFQPLPFYRAFPIK